MLLFHVYCLRGVSFYALSFCFPLLALSLLPSSADQFPCASCHWYSCLNSFVSGLKSVGLCSFDPCISLPWSSTSDSSAAKDVAQYLVPIVPIRF